MAAGKMATCSSFRPAAAARDLFRAGAMLAVGDNGSFQTACASFCHGCWGMRERITRTSPAVLLF